MRVVAMVRNVRRVGRTALLLTFAAMVAVGLVSPERALADNGPQIATATTQDLLSPVRGLSVIWRGRTISALPFRIRLLDQASPLAYSLDIRRPVAYGDSWTGISLGSPANRQARSQSQLGVVNPLIAEAIARGDVTAAKPPQLAKTNLELAARQVAIWASANGLRLDRKAVPNGALRRRAEKLLAGTKGIQVPLQAASHSVGIFVQNTTANTVQLVVTIALDPNLHPSQPQNIDVYLDGVRCHIRTRALTHIYQRSNGTYYADQPIPLSSSTHSTAIAEVDLHRNTQVVEATANWVNVISAPGLVMGGAGAAPPLVTAENAVLNFSTSTQLDPSKYNSPEQLLNNAGTAFLTTLPGWFVWVILLIALYVVARLGRGVDYVLAAGYRRFRPKPEPSPVAKVDPAAVEVEAATENEAIRAGLLALNLTKPEDVQITILQSSPSQDDDTDIPVRVRLTRPARKTVEGAAAARRLPAPRQP
jgi:hypothetical protein